MELKYWDSMKYLEEQIARSKNTLPGPDEVPESTPLEEECIPDIDLVFAGSVFDETEDATQEPPVSEDELCLNVDLDKLESSEAEYIDDPVAPVDTVEPVDPAYPADPVYPADPADKADPDDEEDLPMEGKIIRLPGAETHKSGFHMTPLQIIIAIVIGIPIGIPLFGISVTLFGAIAVVLMVLTVISCVVSLGGLAGGMAAVILGIVTVFQSAIPGILMVGIGLLAVGIGALFIFPTGFFAGKGVPAAASGLSKVCDKLINVFI